VAYLSALFAVTTLATVDLANIENAAAENMAELLNL
jgi:hypothetical protein